MNGEKQPTPGTIERPILFNGAMVRAILDGRKTVTRRVVKPQPDFLGSMTDPTTPFKTLGAGLHGQIVCPYGKPGDRLWVRETWQGPLIDDDEMRADSSWWKNMSRYQNPAHCAYRASGDSCEFVDPDGDMQCRWKPSIHMPRWASRILLEVTDVRVERLQAITRSDIRAEGLQCPPELASDDVSPNYRDWYPAAFRELWNSTGGDWDANPWVWVVEFKRVEANAE